MGEAAKRRRSSEAFLEQNPFCCFCGGDTPATTVDHIPSKQMFSMKQRPKGLEFSACKIYNERSSQHEQVAAMLGRIYPDAEIVPEREETGRIIHAVGNNNPGVLAEMYGDRSKLLDYRRQSGFDSHRTVFLSGPLLNRSLGIFGAKVGLALHYEKTHEIVPLQGGVAVRWFSNIDLWENRIPLSILGLMGKPEALRQGKFVTHEQFSFSYVVTDNNMMGSYLAAFRMSFAILAWVAADSKVFDEVKDGMKIFPVGFLREA